MTDQPDDFSGLFAPEAPSEPATAPPTPEPWKVLIVDDEEDIHAVLRFALKDLRVEGRGLQLIDAHSLAEARLQVARHPDLSLILLDVVMESELAGLELVHHIRREICNQMVQIVLVTGQPGHAPQRQVVTDYEIDGYRLKSELTADKIFVSVHVALRTYKALRESERQRAKVEEMARALGEREQRLRSVVETAPDAIIQTDETGRITGWNEGAARLFGYSAEEMIGLLLTRLIPDAKDVHGEDARGWLQGGSEKLPSGQAFETEGLGRAGQTFPVEVVLGCWHAGEATNYSAVIRDITERKRAEASLRLAASVYASSYEGIIIANPDTLIVDVNPAFTRITGYPRSEVIGRSPKLLASGRHDAAFYERMWVSLNQHDFWQGEICNRRRNGEVFTEMLSLSVIRDRAGALQHYVGVFADISLLKAHADELYRIAHFDPLTGVPNRRLLFDRLEGALTRSRQSGLALAVCYLDIDGFKEVNDTFGHGSGDQLLIELARRMKGVLRAGDTLARLGGDEFVVLLTELAQAQDCQHALNRLLQVVQDPTDVGGGQVRISASIGVALYPDDDADADTLLRHADQAMYSAKLAGKNACQFFDPGHDRQLQSRRTSLQRLREALEHDELVLYYQPKIELATGDVVGFEALIRWQHPDRGLLSPAEFLSVLTGDELEVRVGEWVIETALRQVAAWQAEGLDACVSVNVSAPHLLRPDFASRLQAILDRVPGVLASRLELEILETAALTDMKAAVDTLTRCRQLGVQFALDDFGTGYSSLTYFLNLPVQVLKVDKSFVMAMLNDPAGLEIVESVVRLAQAFNRPVVAEGVETMAHAAMLMHIGCALAQGHAIARAMQPMLVPAWAEQWRAAEAWKEWPEADLGPDVTLDVAARSLEDWVAAARATLTAPDAPGAWRPDESGSAFSRWYRSSGSARYGLLPEFLAMAAPHDVAVRLAQGMFRAVQEGRPDDAARELAAMDEHCQRVLGSLRKLARRSGATGVELGSSLQD